MLNLFKVNMSKNAYIEVEKVLSSGHVTQGKMVDKFEEELKKELKTTKNPVLVNSCTSAIDIALHLCGVIPGKDVEVISTPQTCFASNAGVITRGARIKWADIDPLTGLIDPNSVEKLITEKTAAIIAVNWSGKFANYAKLKSFGIPVIEDAAHTWDTFNNVQVERGDYICYSLQAIKFLTAGDGGILLTPQDREHEARLLRWYGLDRTKNESFRITQNISQAGFKYNMNDISAAIGISNIKNANNAVKVHRNNAKNLIKNISNKNLTIGEFDETASYWIFPLIVNEPSQRDNFIEYLKNNHIESALVHFRNDMYDATYQFKEKQLLGVDSFTEKQLNIPCGWWLDAEDILYIINIIDKWSPDA